MQIRLQRTSISKTLFIVLTCSFFLFASIKQVHRQVKCTVRLLRLNTWFLKSTGNTFLSDVMNTKTGALPGSARYL